MDIKNLNLNNDNILKFQMHKGLTGYPSIDLPQSKESKYFEKNPIIPNIDLITILKLLSAKTRNNPAIDCNDLYATYQQLIDDSHTVYLALKQLGVKKGDIITIALPSNYQALCLYCALDELGAITTYIDTYASEAEITNYLNTYNSPIFVNCGKSVEENERQNI